jgi:hypothetical protein
MLASFSVFAGDAILGLPLAVRERGRSQAGELDLDGHVRLRERLRWRGYTSASAATTRLPTLHTSRVTASKKSVDAALWG